MCNKIGGGVSAELQNDKFKAGTISVSLGHLYNKVTKFDVDGRHGNDVVYKDAQGHAIRGRNNFSYAAPAPKVTLEGTPW